MRGTAIIALAALALPVSTGVGAAQQDEAQAEALEYVRSVDRDRKVMIPMRDGVRMVAEIYYPEGPRENLPTVLFRTPYNLAGEEVNWAQNVADFLRNGYAVIFSNERGRYWSEGHFTYLVGARDDAYDTVDWIVNRPWSNGKVGTLGCSSSAENQLGLSTTDHPGHAAMIPMGAGAGIGEVGPFHEQGNWYRGGAWQGVWLSWYYRAGYSDFPTFRRDLTREDRIRLARFYDLEAEIPPMNLDSVVWHLPLMDMMEAIEGPPSDFNTFVRRFPGDPAWDEVELAGEGDTIGVPALHVDSWYDLSIGPNLALFEYAQEHASDAEAAENQFVVVAPTAHCQQGDYETENTYVGARNMGDARFDYQQLYLDWFDHWLKGVDNGVTERPKVLAYTLVENEWETYADWPPPEAEPVVWYLDSDGRANTRVGDGVLRREAPTEAGVDRFTYDPATPVPSLGGSICCFSEDFVPGAFDQSGIEMRGDVLVYTSPVLEEGIQVTGWIDVILNVSSDARDTDFTAKLIDVDEQGRAWNVDESIQRARWREGYDEAVFMEEGEVYEVRVGPLATSTYFPPGHRIRVEISSSNFPRFGRNLNTGGNNYDESEGVVAHNAVHHSPEHPSRIVLPVVPAGR